MGPFEIFLRAGRFGHEGTEDVPVLIELSYDAFVRIEKLLLKKLKQNLQLY